MQTNGFDCSCIIASLGLSLPKPQKHAEIDCLETSLGDETALLAGQQREREVAAAVFGPMGGPGEAIMRSFFPLDFALSFICLMCDLGPRLQKGGICFERGKGEGVQENKMYVNKSAGHHVVRPGVIAR